MARFASAAALRSGQKNNIGTYIFEFLDEFGTANDIDGPEAFLFREGDYGSPYSGIRGVLNNPITAASEKRTPREAVLRPAD